MYKIIDACGKTHYYESLTTYQRYWKQHWRYWLSGQKLGWGISWQRHPAGFEMKCKQGTAVWERIL